MARAETAGMPMLASVIEGCRLGENRGESESRARVKGMAWRICQDVTHLVPAPRVL